MNQIWDEISDEAIDSAWNIPNLDKFLIPDDDDSDDEEFWPDEQ